MNFEFLNINYAISKEVFDLVEKADKELEKYFSVYKDIREHNQIKILNAFRKNQLSQSDLTYTTGYGYGDSGRDKTEKIFAHVFGTEDALVRPAITSGTHALAITLNAVLQYGDKMLSITDDPYDTLLEVIGIKRNEYGNLISKGIKYASLSLKDNKIQLDKIKDLLSDDVKLIYIQRSTGYGLKRALTIGEIEEAISYVKSINPKLLVMVDNCYGEFTDYKEPTQVGADIAVGSLIKNPGGGIALSGGYIVSNYEIIKMVSNQLFAPGIGKETGLTFDTTRGTLQGLYFAPHVTNQAIRAALLFAKVFSDLSYDIYPKLNDKRSDIIQAIVFNDPNKLIAFVQGVQKASTVGAHVTPMPWDMPGYSDQVIMAAGGFVDGSSIEISADGPLRSPYVAYYQGSLVYEQAKLGCMCALQNLKDRGLA